MGTKNILDSLGNIIGSLTLPDTTTEIEWTAALDPYAIANPVAIIPAVISTITLTATSSVSTSSSTPATITGMSATPLPGKYLILFNGSIATNGASASGKFGIYVNNSELSETIRPVSCNLQLLGGLVTVSLNTLGVGTYTGTEVILNGVQTIDVKFFSTNGGTISFNERVMTLVKVA